MVEASSLLIRISRHRQFDPSPGTLISSFVISLFFCVFCFDMSPNKSFVPEPSCLLCRFWARLISDSSQKGLSNVPFVALYKPGPLRENHSPVEQSV